MISMSLAGMQHLLLNTCTDFAEHESILYKDKTRETNLNVLEMCVVLS